MKKRGRITFVFDDGYQHILEDIVPLLNSHGIKAVFAIPTSPAKTVMDNEKLASIETWASVATAGHEIAAHSVTHPNLTTLHTQELEEELRPAEQLSITTLVYPGGAYNEDVVIMAKKYYRAARGVKKGFEDLFPKDLFSLKTFNFTKYNFSVLKANIAALYAWIVNCWLIETYHVVKDNAPLSKYAVSRQDFIKHLEFVKQLPLEITTIQDVTKNI